ncbi:MAG: hypothetical protein HY722_12905 [Planctomycetes bacterium]|nr:hypothetical protein [Planctomycetota bacterium]
MTTPLLRILVIAILAALGVATVREHQTAARHAYRIPQKREWIRQLEERRRQLELAVDHLRRRDELLSRSHLAPQSSPAETTCGH